MASRRSRDEDFGLKKSSGVNYAQVADRHVDDERFERQRAVRAAAAAPPVEKRKEAPSAAVAAPQSATMDAFMRMLTGKEERTIADRISDPNRPTWEQYKKDNADKLDLNDKGEKEMREYRRKLDAEREKAGASRAAAAFLPRLSRAGSGDKKKKKRKKRSRSESSSEDSDSDDDRRRSRKRSRKSKKRHKRRHSSSDESEDSESDSDARSRAKKRKSKKSRKASSKRGKDKDKDKDKGKDKEKERSASASPVRLSSFFQQQDDASDSDA